MFAHLIFLYFKFVTNVKNTCPAHIWNVPFCVFCNTHFKLSLYLSFTTDHDFLLFFTWLILPTSVQSIILSYMCEMFSPYLSNKFGISHGFHLFALVCISWRRTLSQLWRPVMVGDHRLGPLCILLFPRVYPLLWPQIFIEVDF